MKKEHWWSFLTDPGDCDVSKGMASLPERQSLFDIARFVLDNSGITPIDLWRADGRKIVSSRIKQPFPSESLARAGAVKVLEYHIKKHILPQPHHLSAIPDCFPVGRLVIPRQHIGCYRVLSGYFARIGDAPVIFSRHQKIIPSCSSRFADVLGLLRPVVAACLSSAPFVDGTVLCLMGDYDSNNYSHWLLDELPRLGLAGQAITGGDFFVAVRRLSKPFQFETLRRCGIEEKNIIQIDDFSAIQARNLIVFNDVASDTIPAHHGAMPVIDWLRRQLPLQKKPATPAKIYLARDDAMGRRIVQDEALSHLLSKKGYQRIVMGSLPVSQQVALFAGATHIIAPHGAGLANLVFSPPGQQVIEIFPKSYGTPSAFILATAIGGQYATFVADTTIPGARPQLDDMMIDADRFLSLAGGLL